jgi:hypothetical protein
MLGKGLFVLTNAFLDNSHSINHLRQSLPFLCNIQVRIGDKVFTDVSTGGAPRSINPSVQKALDKIPEAQRSPYHGACAEVGCLSQAKNAGVNPAGGSSQAVRIRADGKQAHGSFMDACSSCSALLDYFGVKH